MEYAVGLIAIVQVGMIIWLYKANQNSNKHVRVLKQHESRINELEVYGFTDYREVLEMQDRLYKTLDKEGVKHE